MGVWIGCRFAVSRADRFLYVAGVGQLMQLRQLQFMQLGRGGFSWRSVLSLVPGIREAPFLRDFPCRWGRGGGGSSWQPAKCAVIGPWDLRGSSIRDFLARGREMRGGPLWPPGSDLTPLIFRRHVPPKPQNLPAFVLCSPDILWKKVKSRL